MKKLLFLVLAAIVLFALVFFFRAGNIGTATLWNLSNGGKWLLPLVGVAALIDSINPCAFYIFGIFVCYMLIGLGFFQALHIFNPPHFMAKVGATLLVALGAINLINQFLPSFPIKLRIPQVAHRKMAELMEKGSVP